MKARVQDARRIAALAMQMWEGHTIDELETEFCDILQSEDACCFLQCVEGRVVAFAQCGLRHDYVEGTGTSPVGYLEGILVEEAYRHRGIARALLLECEAWARDKGCVEFASDCALGNDMSQRFHLAMGFEEANRIICFTKRL